MKNSTALILGLAIGGIAGGGTTYILLNKKMEDTISETINKELDSIHAKEKQNRGNDSKPVEEEPEKEFTEVDVKDYRNAVENYATIFAKKRAKKTLVEAEVEQEIADAKDDIDEPYLEDVPEEEPEDEDEGGFDIEDDVEGGEPGQYFLRGTNTPYSIEPQEFEDDGCPFEKETLHYYPEVERLVNDYTEDVSIIETIRDCLDEIGLYSPDIIHVRNERLKMDYEVVQEIGEPELGY